MSDSDSDSAVSLGIETNRFNTSLFFGAPKKRSRVSGRRPSRPAAVDLGSDSDYNVDDVDKILSDRPSR